VISLSTYRNVTQDFHCKTKEIEHLEDEGVDMIVILNTIHRNNKGEYELQSSGSRNGLWLVLVKRVKIISDPINQRNLLNKIRSIKPPSRALTAELAV
jgi:hypothetical protein